MAQDTDDYIYDRRLVERHVLKGKKTTAAKFSEHLTKLTDQQGAFDEVPIDDALLMGTRGDEVKLKAATVRDEEHAID